MAATVGVSISSNTFPDRHAGFGPFISAAGNVYHLGRGTTNTGNMNVGKSADPINTSFSVAGGGPKLMSSGATTAFQAAAAYQVGDVIHLVTQISTGAVYYNSFNMGTDAWTLTTSETAVAAASFAPTTGVTFVSLVVRSGGEVVIAYCAGLTAMSSGLNMWRYVRRTGTNTYGTATNVDNGGSNNYSGGQAVLGASDRVHFHLYNDSANTCHERTLTSANALETFPSSLGNGPTANPFAWGNGVSYDDAGTTRIRHVHHEPTRAQIDKYDSADSPGGSIAHDSNVGDTSAKFTNGQPASVVVNDGTDLHLLFSDSTSTDLMHDASSGNGGAWGTDVNELAGTINAITSNVYTRSGTKYLAMVVDDGGTVKYAEITLTAAAPKSFIWPTETPYRILSRR